MTEEGGFSPPHSHCGHWKSVSSGSIFIAFLLVRAGNNARQEWKEEGDLEKSMTVMGTPT